MCIITEKYIFKNANAGMSCKKKKNNKQENNHRNCTILSARLHNKAKNKTEINKQTDQGETQNR